MKRGSKLSAGFTLVELLVVMGIMGLVLVVVLNAKPKTVATRVAVTARMMANSLRLARAQAMASNMEIVFQIDAEKLRFGSQRSMQALPKGMAVAMNLAAAERVANMGGIRFFPDGQSTGGEIALTLDGRSARIDVNWLTGEPRIE